MDRAEAFALWGVFFLRSLKKALPRGGVVGHTGGREVAEAAPLETFFDSVLFLWEVLKQNSLIGPDRS